MTRPSSQSSSVMLMLALGKARLISQSRACSWCSGTNVTALAVG